MNTHTDSAVTDLRRWSLVQLGLADNHPAEFSVVSGDASFRRYYRLSLEGDQHFIAVHAPPDKENNEAFISVQQLMAAQELPVPALLGWDLNRGFLLQEDFGDRLLRPALVDVKAADHYYRRAFSSLAAMQGIAVDGGELPDYDEHRLLEEMSLFPQWFVQGLLGYSLSDDEYTMLARLFSALSQRAQAQPQGFVHRDFHSRNIMLLPDGQLGLIDFQDALRGPLTYDLVSLLRDCYVAWPEEQVRNWALAFRGELAAAGVAVPEEAEYIKDFDWMGLQRHIKVLGIFARLHLRDGKASYLGDLPLVIAYTLSVARQYEECAEFVRWFETRLQPLAAKQDWYREVAL